MSKKYRAVVMAPHTLEVHGLNLEDAARTAKAKVRAISNRRGLKMRQCGTPLEVKLHTLEELE